MGEGQQIPSRSLRQPRPMTDERSDRYPQFKVPYVRFKGCGATGVKEGGGFRRLEGGPGGFCSEGKLKWEGGKVKHCDVFSILQ